MKAFEPFDGLSLQSILSPLQKERKTERMVPDSSDTDFPPMKIIPNSEIGYLCRLDMFISYLSKSIVKKVTPKAYCCYLSKRLLEKGDLFLNKAYKSEEYQRNIIIHQRNGSFGKINGVAKTPCPL